MPLGHVAAVRWASGGKGGRYKEVKVVVKKKVLELFRQSSAGIAAGAALSFLYTVYGPLELYFTNQGDFWFDFYTILPWCCLLFLAGCLAVAVLVMLCCCIHKNAGYAAAALLFAVLLYSYIQGTFLVYNMPLMDGTVIQWSDYATDNLISIIVFIAVAGCVAVACVWQRGLMEKIIRYISLALSALLLITVTTLCITTKGYEDSDYLVATDKNMYQMSTDTNFVILLFDSVDAQKLKEIMEENPVYQDYFTDFTNFDNALAAYSSTVFSVPFILTGEWYEHQMRFQTFWDKTSKASRLFSMLEEQSYRLAVYDDELKFNKKMHTGRFENMSDGRFTVSSNRELVKVILKMGAIKQVPFDWKYYCYDLPTLVKELRSTDDGQEHRLVSSYNDDFMYWIDRTPVVYTEDKCFKFIYLEGAHVPYVYAPDASRLEGDTGSYTWSIQACLEIAHKYIEKLKESGSYDNTAIILMADHGYDEESNAAGTDTSRQNPMFMVKGVGERHAYQVSNAPISYEDLQEAYRRLLEGKKSTDCFDAKEGDDRKRRYLFYRNVSAYHMIEYIQTGQARDMATLQPTGNEYFSKEESLWR